MSETKNRSELRVNIMQPETHHVCLVCKQQKFAETFVCNMTHIFMLKELFIVYLNFTIVDTRYLERHTYIFSEYVCFPKQLLLMQNS